MNIKDKVKNLSSSPGVYLMKDSLGGIIYVGKAKNLKNRVQSYFLNSKSRPPKVEKLVKNLKDFDYIVTDTEFEAFMLECKLIKELKPTYNKLMKSPLSYTYIVIKMTEKYPSLEVVDGCSENDGNLYFGPYTRRSTVERALQGIKEYLKILCSSPAKKNTECLNYSLGLCIGMCFGISTVEHYLSIIKKIIALLDGSDTEVIEDMKKKMLYASEKFDFETAAKFRDYISAINSLINKERVIEFTKENKNIAIVEYLDDSTLKLFLIKGNKVIYSKKYLLEGTDAKKSGAIIVENILAYFKAEPNSLSTGISKYEIDEAQIIYSYLNGITNYIIIPEIWLSPENNTCLTEALDKLLQR